MQPKKKIHFIGIGGIGMSALAGYYLSKGYRVSGSDLDKSAITNALERQGAKIFFGPHRTANLGLDANLVVYTSAATPNNPELKKAKKLGIKIQTYPQALGELTKKMYTIAVSGMHGKSTTTAMLALVLEKAGLDPTVIVGTKLREWGNNKKIKIKKEKLKMSDGKNFRVGQSKYLVIEADEYKAAFLNYWPKIIVLTNIEEEHLDFYKDLKHIMKIFRKYVKHLGRNGILVANGQDENVVKLVKQVRCKVVFYRDSVPSKGTESLKLRIPGKHNISNAMAVLAVAKILGVPEKKAIESLNNFTGTWRRMEFRGEINNAKIYDDYGHHPTEIKATLEGARELLRSPAFSAKGGSAAGGRQRQKRSKKSHPKGWTPGGGRIWCIFQPHQYQRTYKLFDQFISAFDDADKIIILPIYSVPGREKESIKKKVNSEMLVKAIIKNYELRIMNHEIKYVVSFAAARNYLKKNLKKGDMAIIMGAGDVYKLTEMLLE